MRRSLIAASVLLFPTFLAADTVSGYLVATRSVPALTKQALFARSDWRASHSVEEFQSVRGFAADLTEAEVADLRKSPEVLFIEPDREVHAFDAGPSVWKRDPAAATTTADTMPYGISAVRASLVWPFRNGAGIKVGIIDTGIDAEHPDLKGFIGGGRNFIAESDNFSDDNGHGTHVAGTIAARANGIGVVGVAPGAILYGLKVLGANGSGTTRDIIQAIDWAIEKKLHIVSLSLGADAATLLERQAFERLADAGILAIAASGNEGAVNLSYPAGYPTVVSVGAVDESSNIAAFSNRGTGLDFVGPGVDVLSTVIRGSATSASVTSSGQRRTAAAMTGSPRGSVQGKAVLCGLGSVTDFPSNVRGAVAVIERGVSTFAEKVKNAKAAGAVAVVIFNREPGLFSGTLAADPLDAGVSWILTVSVSQADGQAIANGADLVVDSRADDYGYKSGTSMATPHVSGVAALVWSTSPGATADQVVAAMTATAKDLGEEGWDGRYGNGLVDAYAASRRLAPAVVPAEAPPPPPPAAGRRRIVR